MATKYKLPNSGADTKVGSMSIPAPGTLGKAGTLGKPGTLGKTGKLKIKGV